MRPSSLRRVLAINIGVIAVLPLLLLAAMVLPREWALLDQSRDEPRILAESVSAQTRLYLQAPAQLLAALGSALQTGQFDPRETDELLDSSVAGTELFDSVLLLDAQSRVIRVGLPAPLRARRAEYLDLDLSAQTVVAAARQRDGPVWSDLHDAVVGGGPGFTLALSLGDRLLLGSFSGERLTKFLNSIAGIDAGVVMILDRTGRPLARVEAPPADPVVLPQDLASLDPAGRALVGRALAGVTAQADFRLAGTGYSGAAAAVAGPGWVTLVALPGSGRYANALVSFGALLLAVLLAAALAIWIALRRARAIAAPLQRFAEQARALADGEDLPPHRASDIREIDELAATLARMAAVVSEREQRQQESEQRYRDLVETTGDLVLRIDAERRVTFASCITEAILGVAPQDCIGSPLERWIHYEDRAGLLASLRDWPDPDCERISVEARVLPGRGGVRDILWSVIVKRDADGRIQGFTCVGRDISERRRFEQKLMQQHESIERSAIEEQTLLRLSALSLQAMPLQQFLNQSLDQLLSTAVWMPIQSRGVVLVQGRESGATPELLASTGVEALEIERLRRIHPRMLDEGQAALPELCLCYSIGATEDGAVGLLALFTRQGWLLSPRELNFLNRAVDILRLGVMRRLAEAQTQQLAYFDALTGLPNRRLLVDRIALQLSSARRHGWFGALMRVDLDHFKTLNDTLGQAVGDALLRQVAERLSERFRGNDTVARLGGDEFVLALSLGAEDREHAVHAARSIADQVCTLLSRPYRHGEQNHHLTASVGIVIFPGAEEDDDKRLLGKAAAALSSAKERGRNGTQFFEQSMQVEADTRLRFGRELRDALAREEFVLHYQPRLARGGMVIGAEALIRWQHPELGLIGPDSFIAAAEETGAIVDIGAWVIHTACRQLAQWQSQDFMACCRHLSVNVSRWQFRQRGFVDRVREEIERSGVDPAGLVLDLTEAMLLDSVDDAGVKMRALKGLGVKFALDDFGTGYSSLHHLNALPVDEIKIDRRFVGDIESDAGGATVVDAMIAMAQRLSLQVVAEGVETPGQLGFLSDRGCQHFQGFFFSHPLTAADFVALCRRQSAEAGRTT